jgi:hypothetical protein
MADSRTKVKLRYVGTEPLSLHYNVDGITEFLTGKEYELETIEHINRLVSTGLFVAVKAPVVEVPVEEIQLPTEVESESSNSSKKKSTPDNK